MWNSTAGAKAAADSREGAASEERLQTVDVPINLDDMCMCNTVCPIGPDGKYMCHLKSAIYTPCSGLRKVRA